MVLTPLKDTGSLRGRGLNRKFRDLLRNMERFSLLGRRDTMERTAITMRSTQKGLTTTLLAIAMGVF